MSPPSWPLGPMRLPVRHGPIDDAIRFENARGSTKSRPRSSLRRHAATVTLRLDPAELDVLERFWAETLERGAFPFLWLDPIDLARRIETPREMTFASPPAYETPSPGWTLATLELRFSR